MIETTPEERMMLLKRLHVPTNHLVDHNYYVFVGLNEHVEAFLELPLEVVPLYVNDAFLEPYALWRLEIAK